MSTQKLGSVTLPPINTGRNHGGASPGQINGIITNRANAHQLIYRSVPPKNSGESFSDMLGGSPMGKYGKQSIVSSNSPLEYAERFKAKPMTKPNLVQFTTGELDKVKRHSNSMRTSRRKIEGFFPPMKLRQNGKPLSPDMEVSISFLNSFISAQYKHNCQQGTGWNVMYKNLNCKTHLNVLPVHHRYLPVLEHSSVPIIISNWKIVVMKVL